MLKAYILLSITVIITFIVFSVVIDLQVTTPVYKRDVGVKGSIIRNKKPRTSLVFLKTHKCASSTVQNIIMRFGLKRGLLFVLPYVGNYLGNPARFNHDLINKFAMPRNKKFDLFAHHTRYNRDTIKTVMKEDAAFVTILRDPADLFESLFTFYLNSFKRYNITWEKLVHTRNTTLLKRGVKTRYGANQMLFDLGLDEIIFSSDINVNNYIRIIDSEFDLVMISEYMEASLVLFADLMRWRLEDVVFLNLNTRNNSRRRRLTSFQRQSLHEINHADWLLYNYFLQRFRLKIIRYGTVRFMADVNRLISLNMDLKRKCVASINERGYAKTISYTLRDESWLCTHASMNELLFTNEIRNFQVERLSVLNKLNNFINRNSELLVLNHSRNIGISKRIY